MLRAWRQCQRLRQLELALDAGISTRHLSLVETGSIEAFFAPDVPTFEHSSRAMAPA